MYQVLALFHKYKDQHVKPFYVVKEYKKLSSAEKFVKQQQNRKFYFEIINNDE